MAGTRDIELANRKTPWLRVVLSRPCDRKIRMDGALDIIADT